MLSDQCPFGITVVSKHYGAVYEGSGSILGQLNTSLDVLECMNPRVVMKGYSLPMRRFPRNGVLESMVNAVIHSDLSLSGRICVEVGPDDITVSSPGGTWETGNNPGCISPVPRNRLLAQLMRCMGLAKLEKSGLRTIMDSYRNTCLLPGIDRNESRFSVILPAFTQEVRDYEREKRLLIGFLEDSRGATMRQISKHMLTNKYYTRKLVRKVESEGLIFGMGPYSDRCYYPCKVSRKGNWTGVPVTGGGKIGT